MSKVVHFEIHSKNIDKAKDFFSKVFDWNFDRWGGPKNYWLLNTPESELKATIIEAVDDLQGVINTVEVSSVDDTLKKVESNGGKVLVKKTAVESTGFIAYFSDVDGNVFGIVEKNSLAK